MARLQPHEARKVTPKAEPSRKKCGAKRKDGGKCKRGGMENGRCYRHGGATPRGEASPHFIHGQRMRHMPASLRKLGQEAAGDPDLLQIRYDLATIEALMNDLTGRLKDGKAVTLRNEHRIVNLIEQRRKLIETEAKRLRDLNQMVPGERFLGAMGAAADAISKVIKAMCFEGVTAGTDPTVWGDQVRRRFQQLRLPANAIDGAKTDA